MYSLCPLQNTPYTACKSSVLCSSAVRAQQCGGLGPYIGWVRRPAAVAAAHCPSQNAAVLVERGGFRSEKRKKRRKRPHRLEQWLGHGSLGQSGLGASKASLRSTATSYALKCQRRDAFYRVLFLYAKCSPITPAAKRWNCK